MKEEIKNKTNVDVTETIIDDELVVVKFNIEGKKETGEISYKVGGEEMTVLYHGENGIGTGSESFNYGQPMNETHVFEAVEFGHGFLKENL